MGGWWGGWRLKEAVRVSTCLQACLRCPSVCCMAGKDQSGDLNPEMVGWSLDS